jgi:1-aminocyclopropane-1-carboxylate deaminase
MTLAVTLPKPFASIPRSDFLFGPSPVHHLPRISEALGGKVAIWAKREDCNSGIAFGGNKTRKLEYFPRPPLLSLKRSVLTELTDILFPKPLLKDVIL